ncbi:MAG: DegT/DnrJ/EryC1/StrS family aminotransferase [Bacteroidia bacterium]|nr:DegT/DnrJ/EryC1/StrS family aminotransferase [Bacteroidia bacterium]
MKTKLNIPLSKPDISEAEIQKVNEVLRSPRLSLGPVTQEFEEIFAETMGSKYAVACNSGTSALHLAIRALGISDRDEVITSPFSFIASANCILFERGTPVFVDVEANSFNMDVSLIEAAITPKTKAILPVHVFGQCSNMTEIMALAKKYNLKVIEDACEAPLGTHRGQISGTIGDCGAFGFYPNKQMTTGEGGMLITNDDEIYRLTRSMRNQGRGDDMQWLSHTRLGYNYRINELTAALGVVQTRRLPEFISQRQRLANKYLEMLKDIDGIRLPETSEGNEHAWFVFGIRVREEIRDQLIEELNNTGVQSKAYFSPCIHLQEFYMESYGYKEGDYPVAESLSHEMVILPFYPQMTDEEVAYVYENLKTIMGKLN